VKSETIIRVNKGAILLDKVKTDHLSLKAHSLVINVHLKDNLCRGVYLQINIKELRLMETRLKETATQNSLTSIAV